MIESLFIAAIVAILHSYALYPALLFIAARIFKKSEGHGRAGSTFTGTVAVLCAMYNEERHAGGKIENHLQNGMGYPMLIGSDGSTDATNRILAGQTGVGQIAARFYSRRGKVHVINDLISESTQEILVFTDANSILLQGSLEKLLRHFKDPRIGVVSGRLRIIEKDDVSGEGLYWRYETAIKRLESKFSCLIGANGAFYAVRRSLIDPIPATTINDDFVISMRAVQKGFLSIYEEEAIATEEGGADDTTEFRRHVRDGAGHYRAMATLWRMLNPLTLKPFFFYFSHRVLRWIAPFLLLFILAVSVFIDFAFPILNWLRFGVLSFFGMAVLGALFRRIKVLYLPFYFCYINLALLCGFFWNIFYSKRVSWKTLRS